MHTDLRISNVYGAGISHGFIGSLFDSIKTGSEILVLENLNITRDYIYVEDVVYATETFDVTTIRASTPMYLLSKYIRNNT